MRSWYDFHEDKCPDQHVIVKKSVVSRFLMKECSVYSSCWILEKVSQFPKESPETDIDFEIPASRKNSPFIKLGGFLQKKV